MDANETVSISSELIETVIGEHTKFKGTVDTDKPFRIDGYYEGSILSSSLVLVTPSGSFYGTIDCKELQIEGRGEGKVICRDVLRIAETGVFTGDIQTVDLITVRGSVIDGTCSISNMRSK